MTRGVLPLFLRFNFSSFFLLTNLILRDKDKKVRILQELFVRFIFCRLLGIRFYFANELILKSY